MFRTFREYVTEVVSFVEEPNPDTILPKLTNDLIHVVTSLIGVEKCCMQERKTLLVAERKAYPPTECMRVSDVYWKGLPLFAPTVDRSMAMRPSADIRPGSIVLNFDADEIEITYWLLPVDDCGQILIPEVIFETAVTWAQSQQLRSPRARRIHGENMYQSTRIEAIRAANKAKNQIDAITPLKLRTIMSTVHLNHYSHHDFIGGTEI